MSHPQRVFRNTAVLSMARIIERLSGLALTLLISRQLGASALGIYGTVMAYYGVVAIAGNAGTTNLLIRELAQDRTRTPSYVTHASVMATGFVLVMMAIVWSVIPYLGYPADLRHGLALIVLALLPGTLNTIQEAVFIAHGRVEFETATTFVSSLVLVGTSFVLVLHGHGVVTLVAAFVVVEFAVTVVYFVLINRYIARLHFEFRRTVAIEILSKIKAFAASSVVAGVFARPEILILSLVGSTTEVGYYSGARKVVDLLGFVPEVYATNVYPALSRSFDARDGRAQEIQNLATRYLLSLALPVSVGLFVAAPGIIQGFFGSSFHDAVPLLRIMAFSYGLGTLHDLLWRVLAARGDQAQTLRLLLITTFFRLAGGVALITAFHGTGAAITITLTLLLHDVLLARAVRADGTRISLVRLGWRFAGGAALMGLVCFALQRAAPLWVVVPLAVVVYLVLILAFRAFSPDEVAAIKRALYAPFLRLSRTG